MSDGRVRFRSNEYVVGDRRTVYWEWRGRVDWPAFREAGNESSGSWRIAEP